MRFKTRDVHVLNTNKIKCWYEQLIVVFNKVHCAKWCILSLWYSNSFYSKWFEPSQNTFWPTWNRQGTVYKIKDVDNYRRLTNDLSVAQTKPTKGLRTDRLNFTNNTRTKNRPNLTNNRRIETRQWLMTNFTRVFQPIPSWLNWPITLTGSDLKHHRLTNTINLTLKMTSAQVVEMPLLFHHSSVSAVNNFFGYRWNTSLKITCFSHLVVSHFSQPKCPKSDVVRVWLTMPLRKLM